MNKQELIKRAKPYFEKDSVNTMFATEDGNFFHKEDKSYAFGHVSKTKMQVFTITREDLEDKPKKTETIEVNGTEYNLEGLKAVCDKREIKYVESIGLKKLAKRLEVDIEEEKTRADAKAKETEEGKDKKAETIEGENQEKETAEKENKEEGDEEGDEKGANKENSEKSNTDKKDE